jgi:hypothetical protein
MTADFVVHDLWQVAAVLQQLGVMDAAHRVIAEHRLAGCVWAKRSAPAGANVVVPYRIDL